MKQLNLSEAADKRDKALLQVEDNADEEWKALALEFVYQYLLTHEEFFVDDVWEAGLPVPREARAFGPIILTAARRKWMVKTDRAKPSVHSNLSVKPIWISQIYDPEATWNPTT